MIYRASHVAQRVPAPELTDDAHSLQILVISLGLLVAAASLTLGWMVLGTGGTNLL